MLSGTNGRSGFTLIELLIVVVILGLLAVSVFDDGGGGCESTG